MKPQRDRLQPREQRSPIRIWRRPPISLRVTLCDREEVDLILCHDVLEWSRQNSRQSEVRHQRNPTRQRPTKRACACARVFRTTTENGCAHDGLRANLTGGVLRLREVTACRFDSLFIQTTTVAEDLAGLLGLRIISLFCSGQRSSRRPRPI